MNWMNSQSLNKCKLRWIERLPSFALLFVLVPGLLTTACGSGEDEDTGVGPNILLIVLDDFGYNDLGANGNPETPTPNLDALAAQGVRYTRHYADSTCSVARAGLLTGRYPAESGFRPSHLGLSPDTATVASLLRDAGYRTLHIGKWHVGNATPAQSPLHSGFDHWFGFLLQSELAGPSSDGITFARPTYIDPWLRRDQSSLQQYQGHLTDILTEEAVAFLEQQPDGDRPWFLNLWYYAPHSPIQPGEAFRARHPATDEGVYHALVDQLDSNVGRVLRALDQSGQADNTLVIVVSDNGGTNKQTDNNFPFYGRKNQFLEGGVRTPLLLRWPARIQAGGVSDELANLYDLLPTMAAAGAAAIPPRAVGRDLLGSVAAQPAPLYWEYSTSEFHKYSVLAADGRWRLGQDFGGAPGLNDLVTDPAGEVNVIEQYPEIAARLRRDYLQWRHDARILEFAYQPVNQRGRATLHGDDLQRSPGYAGFTFAIGVTPDVNGGEGVQVIADQAERWHLETSLDGSLRLTVLDQTLIGPPLPAGRCSEVVISSHFMLSPINPKVNRAIVDLYIDGERVATDRLENPALHTAGFANPTHVGSAAGGEGVFAGQLGRPLILNERVVPDAEGEKIGNGISGVPAVCPAAEAAAG